MKKQLVMLSRGDQLPSDFVSNFIARPCALSDPNGLPHKGNKSKATDFFETRYKRFDVIVSTFPSGWIPDSVILEGMFLIQTAPPPGVSTFEQYTDMLLSRFITLIYVLVPWQCTFFLMAPLIQLSLQKKLNDKKGITYYQSITSMNVCQLNPKELSPQTGEVCF